MATLWNPTFLHFFSIWYGISLSYIPIVKSCCGPFRPRRIGCANLIRFQSAPDEVWDRGTGGERCVVYIPTAWGVVTVLNSLSPNLFEHGSRIHVFLSQQDCNIRLTQHLMLKTRTALWFWGIQPLTTSSIFELLTSLAWAEIIMGLGALRLKISARFVQDMFSTCICKMGVGLKSPEVFVVTKCQQV